MHTNKQQGQIQGEGEGVATPPGKFPNLSDFSCLSLDPEQITQYSLSITQMCRKRESAYKIHYVFGAPDKRQFYIHYPKSNLRKSYDNPGVTIRYDTIRYDTIQY